MRILIIKGLQHYYATIFAPPGLDKVRYTRSQGQKYAPCSDPLVSWCLWYHSTPFQIYWCASHSDCQIWCSQAVVISFVFRRIFTIIKEQHEIIQRNCKSAGL